MSKFTFWSRFSASLTFVLAGSLGVAQAQECPDATATCNDQVVARDVTRPYQQDGRTKVRKVLLYDNAAGHSTGRQAYRQAMIKIARKYGFELVISGATLGYITPATLEGVDVVIFSQGDRDVVPSEVSANALQDFIYRQGKAMLMVHAASAFITCPGVGTSGGGHDIAAASCRFMARATARQYYHHQSSGSPARIYVDSVLAGTRPPYLTRQAASGTATAPWTEVPPIAEINHGIKNDETKNIFNNNAQYNWPLPPNSTTDSRTTVWDNLADEWYTWYNNPGPRAIPEMQREFNGTTYTEGRLNILLSMDETSRYIGGSTDQRIGDHPLSWVRKMGNGLAGYNNIGHDRTPFANARTGSGLGVDSMAQAFLWNYVRFLARDYQGCTNPAFNEYKPWATVTSLTPTDTAGSGNPCKTPVGIAITPKNGKVQGIRAFADGMRIETPDAGFYKVHLSELSGRVIGARTVVGGAGKQVEFNGLRKGAYVLQVTTPGKQTNVSRVVL